MLKSQYLITLKCVLLYVCKKELDKIVPSENTVLSRLELQRVKINWGNDAVSALGLGDPISWFSFN